MNAPDLFDAAAERDRALEIVGENAGAWTDAAVEAIRAIASEQATLTSADVWKRLGEDEPREPRAMGAAICRAKAEGIITPSGLPPVSTERANARKLTVWRSLLWRERNGWAFGNREKKAGRIARKYFADTKGRTRAEIAASIRSLSLQWWKAYAVHVVGEDHEPSDATILRVLEMLESEAPEDASEDGVDSFHPSNVSRRLA